MAGAGYRTFASGEVLTAANTQTYLMDQTITVFADATARDAAITSPTEGQYAFLKDSDTLTFYTDAWVTFTGGGAAGSVLQVVSTTKTETYSESVAGGAISSSVVTNLTAVITPVATSSKIRVDVSTFLASSEDFGYGGFVFRRGSTAIGVGDTAGDRAKVSAAGGAQSNLSNDLVALSQTFVDSPSSTSALTYGISLYNRKGVTATLYLNRTSDDSNLTTVPRTISTVTLTEVAG